MTGHERLEHLSRKLAEKLLPYVPHEANRMLRCVHSLNHPGWQSRYCYSPYCGMCERLKAEWESKLLRRHLEMLQYEKSTYKFLHLTATAPDCKAEQIRSTLASLKAGWRSLVRQQVFQQRCLGWFLTFEVVASARKPSLENAHIHAVAVMTSYSGRDYLSGKRWRDLWKTCVDAKYYRSIEVHQRQNVARLASYLSKYNPAHPKAFLEPLLIGIKTPERLIERQRQVKGLRRYTAGGELRQVNIRPKDSGDGLVDTLYPNQSQWRRRRREFARKQGEFKPVPTAE